MTAQIHQFAVVDPKAQLGADVEVGPFAIVGPDVVLHDGVRLRPHAVVDGHTTLGEGVEVYPGAAVGLPPQDKKYDGSPTTLTVGPRTIIRECATLQPGTMGAGCGTTQVGADCLVMAYVHIAHDCKVGDHVVLANATQIAGHVEIEDHAILGGVTTVHQFCRVGAYSISGASCRVSQDVPPFTTVDGHPGKLVGLNHIGLRRAGFSSERIAALKRAYRAIFVRGPYHKAIDAVEAEFGREFAEVRDFCQFLRTSERGVTRARARTTEDVG